MASSEPPPLEKTERKTMGFAESAIKELLKRLSAESEELAEKAGLEEEPTTPPATGAGVKIEKTHGIEARAIAGLRDAIQSSKALEDLVEVVKDIKSLDLQKGGIGDKGVSSLSRAFRDANVMNLLHLDLSNNGLTDQGFHELTQTIATGFLSGLESLNLSHNHIREEGSGMLARILHIGRLPSLLMLNLSHCYIADYGVQNIASAMQSGHFSSWGLQLLDLSTNGFGEEGAVALAQALGMGRLPYLKHLNLSFNMLAENGTVALAKALDSGKLSTLTDLVMSRCYLGHGVEPIIQSMEAGKLAQLQVLDLSSNYMGGRGCMALVRALRSGKLSNLQKLVISECGIVPKGLELIPQAMEVGNVWGLKHLDMSNNYVNSSSREFEFTARYMESYTRVKRDVVALALARMMKSGHLSDLRYLNLSRVSMTDDGLVTIAEELEVGRLPNLERFLLTDNDIGAGSSLKALVRAVVSGNLPELQELDLGHNVVGDDLTTALASVLEGTNSEHAAESPLVRNLKERQRMAKSTIETILYKLLTFLEAQLGVSLRQRPNTSNILNRLWQRQSASSVSASASSRYAAANDEESVGSASNDSKLLFNVLLVVVWIVAVWMSKW
ncbi:unnamed protein product [Calypogeia fissa]